MRHWRIIFAAVMIFSAGFASAQYSSSEIVSAYRQYKAVSPIIAVPTVIEIPFEDDLERLEFAVWDDTGKKFEPYYFIKNTSDTPVSISSSPGSSASLNMIDGNPGTFTEFAVPVGGGVGKSSVILYTPNVVTASSLSVYLDRNVSFPSSIEIMAHDPGISGDKIILAPVPMRGTVVNFPKTTSGRWTVTFEYLQPLRITELKINQEDALTKNYLRFLAQPGHTYKIYFDPDRYAQPSVGEGGYMATVAAKSVSANSLRNGEYKIADQDADGVPDSSDNCLNLPNPAQEDVNGNGRGDQCDDYDNDGIINSLDNCRDNPNFQQTDRDGDKIGDACDPNESRLTEKYTWIPWLGIGFAALVLIVLFVLTASSIKKPPADIHIE